MNPPSRGVERPSDATAMSLSKNERAQGRPEARRPHGPPAEKNAGGRYHRFGRDIPALPARQLTGLYVISPGTGSLAPVARKTRQHLTSLTPAPGCQDHTTSPSVRTTLVRRSPHVHRSPPLRIVTTRTSLFDEAG
jgi:hypothetical protein